MKFYVQNLTNDLVAGVILIEYSLGFCYDAFMNTNMSKINKFCFAVINLVFIALIWFAPENIPADAKLVYFGSIFFIITLITWRFPGTKEEKRSIYLAIACLAIILYMAYGLICILLD